MPWTEITPPFLRGYGIFKLIGTGLNIEYAEEMTEDYTIIDQIIRDEL